MIVLSVVSQWNATVTVARYQFEEQPPPSQVTVSGAAAVAEGVMINKGTLIRISASG
jgi:hypothetical protein